MIFVEAGLADPGAPAQVVARAGDRVDIPVNNVGAARARPGGFLSMLDHSAARAGLASFAKALSKEFEPRGIRVNTVSPGPIVTDLWLGSDGMAATVSQATGAKPSDVESQAATGRSPAGSPQPAEVAELIL